MAVSLETLQISYNTFMFVQCVKHSGMVLRRIQYSALSCAVLVSWLHPLCYCTCGSALTGIHMPKLNSALNFRLAVLILKPVKKQAGKFHTLSDKYYWRVGDMNLLLKYFYFTIIKKCLIRYNFQYIYHSQFQLYHQK